MVSCHHQSFVIAKVDGQYRALAAINNRDLDGICAVAQCHRQLQIFSHPSNRIALEAELISSKTFFRDRIPPDPNRDFRIYTNHSPFAFISTCLTVGSLHRTDGHPPLAIHPLPYDVPYDLSINGGGIAVIDITDLNKIKYCFVFMSTRYMARSNEGWYPRRIERRFSPLSAWQYLLTYYSEDDKFLKEPQSVAITADLTRWSVIDVRSLAETWGGEKWDMSPASPQPEPDTHTAVTGPRGLVEQTVDKMMKTLQTSSNAVDLDTIKQEMSHFPALKRLVQDWLCQNLHLVDGSPATLSLISMAIDVSSLETLLQSPGFQNVHTISLAASRATSNPPEQLWPVLSTLPHLKVVYLLDPLSVNGFVTCQPFVELAQSDLNIRLDKLTITAPFHHSVYEELWIQDDTSPPLLTPSFPVAQLLIHHERPKIFDLEQYEYFSLADALLSPVRLLTGLFRYMSMMRSLTFVSGGTTTLNVAACFAASSSSLTSTQFGEIGPLPAQIYKYGVDASRMTSHRGRFSAMRDLQPGQWTVLLRQIRSSRFQYAFVKARQMIRIKESVESRKPIEPDMIEVFSVEDFLRDTAPDVDVSGVQNLYSQLLPEGPDTSSVLTLMDTQEACILLDEFVNGTKKADMVKGLLDPPRFAYHAP
ncbi:unnamed protein product [Clonostachys rosea]|uniref:Uncharacterized protein n=1 Tax=Bionectria ochroleuca TaxID=29856 RepID=A0ABY6UTK2_BIOOC|nr:unnamed protein product [Clonostachys rosea]